VRLKRDIRDWRGAGYHCDNIGRIIDVGREMQVLDVRDARNNIGNNLPYNEKGWQAAS